MGIPKFIIIVQIIIIFFIYDRINLGYTVISEQLKQPLDHDYYKRKFTLSVIAVHFVIGTLCTDSLVYCDP